MDKNRFETIKHIVSLDPSVHPVKGLISIDDLRWLVAQAEKVEELETENKKLEKFVEYLQARNKDMVNINHWYLKTNKHLKERISQTEKE